MSQPPGEAFQRLKFDPVYRHPLASEAQILWVSHCAARMRPREAKYAAPHAWNVLTA